MELASRAKAAGSLDASNHDWLERPVFVVGYPKSGTTLVVSLLDGHPQLVVFPEETEFMRAIGSPYARFLPPFGRP